MSRIVQIVKVNRLQFKELHEQSSLPNLLLQGRPRTIDTHLLAREAPTK